MGPAYSQNEPIRTINTNEVYAITSKYSIRQMRVPFSSQNYETLFNQNLVFGFKTPGNPMNHIIEMSPSIINSGPLFGLPNTPSEREILNYNKVWSVLGHDIRYHIKDFSDNNHVDQKIPSLYAWPGRGNPHFEQYNGFKLKRLDYDLAPFYDFNNDQIYNPDHGDYPQIEQANYDIIPSAIYYSVYHILKDLRLEFGFTNWTFHCEENSLLNKAIFSSYKITNYSIEDLVDFKFCSELDIALGCPGDDYIGVDSTSNTCFWYNKNNVDGGSGSNCENMNIGFGSNPPAQFFSYLNHQMGSCAYLHTMHLTGLDKSLISNSNHYNCYLNGFRNNCLPYLNPLTNLQTLFPFNGDVTVSNSWSMYQQNYPYPSNIRLYPTCRPGDIRKGQSIKVDLVLHHVREQNADHLLNVIIGLEQLKEIQDLYSASFKEFCEEGVCNNECVWPGDSDNNGIVEYLDAVQIFKSIGHTGTDRPYASIWTGTSSSSWTTGVPGALNHKYVDANGDGVINADDAQVVTNHYSYFRGVPQRDVIECQEGSDIILSYYTDSILKNPIFANIKIIPGDRTVQGISFQIEGSNNDFSFLFSDSPKIWIDSVNSNFWSNIFGLQSKGLKEDYYSAVWFHPSGQNQACLDTINFRLRVQIKNSEILKKDWQLKICNAKIWFEDGSVKNLYSNRLRYYSTHSVSTENNKKDEYFLYPNPLTDELFIHSNYKIEGVKIIDLAGNCVGNYPGANNRIDISAINCGIYFVEVRTKESLKIGKVYVVRN